MSPRHFLIIAFWFLSPFLLLSCSSSQCIDECHRGEQRCEGNRIAMCLVPQDGSCATWALLPCQKGQICSSQNGKIQCVAGGPQCSNPQDHKECLGKDIYWFDECGQKRDKFITCPDYTQCVNGQCVRSSNCQNPCTLGESRCNGNGIQRCEKDPSTQCPYWTAIVPCQADENCFQAKCQKQCPTPCQKNKTRCLGNGVQTCQKNPQTGCLVWSQAQQCPNGSPCQNGQCTTCPTNCTIGAKRCSGQKVEQCEKHSRCPTWKTVMTCPQGQSCQNGACVSNCTDACQANAKRCSGKDVQICQKNAQGCLTWTKQLSCSPNQKCQNGTCVANCTNACQANTKRCAGNTIQICQKNAQGCLDWTNAQNCPSDKVCSSGTCVAPTDPSQRTEQMVCARWKKDYPKKASVNFKHNSQCDPGSISQGSIDDAIRRLTLFRWLVGLPPTVEDKNLTKKTQACAILQANNNLSGVSPHHPPSTWRCYTKEGGAASGASNLSWGVRHPADTVDQYMSDYGTSSLGHRLWCIAPGLRRTGFGMATGSNRYGVASCMYTFAQGAPAKVDFIAFPAPGPFPIQAMGQTRYSRVLDWSFSSSKYSVSSVKEVQLIRKSDGDVQKLFPRRIGGWYGVPRGIAFKPRFPKAGETYTVKIGNVISYKIHFVYCR